MSNLKLVILRHGESTWNKENKFTGWYDVDLSEKGIEEGKKAGKVCVAYDNLERFFPEDKIVKTGNPVRQDLLFIHTKNEEGKKFFELDEAKKTISGDKATDETGNSFENFENLNFKNGNIIADYLEFKAVQDATFSIINEVDNCKVTFFVPSNGEVTVNNRNEGFFETITSETTKQNLACQKQKALNTYISYK